MSSLLWFMLYSHTIIQAMFVMIHSFHLKIPPERSRAQPQSILHPFHTFTFITDNQTSIMLLIILTDKEHLRWCAHSTWGAHTHNHRVSCTHYQTIAYGLLYWSRPLIRIWWHYYWSNNNCSISLNNNSLQCDDVWKFLVGTYPWKLKGKKIQMNKQCP